MTDIRIGRSVGYFIWTNGMQVILDADDSLVLTLVEIEPIPLSFDEFTKVKAITNDRPEAGEAENAATRTNAHAIGAW